MTLETAPESHAVRKGAALPETALSETALLTKCTMGAVSGEDEADLEISDLEICPAEAEAPSEGTCTGGGRTGGCTDGPGSTGGRIEMDRDGSRWIEIGTGRIGTAAWPAPCRSSS